MIHLRGPQGMVVDFTLPLHETIVEQWRNGVLERVAADGGRWADGDPFDLSTADDAPPPQPEGEGGGQDDGGATGADGEGQEPEQPAGGAAGEPERPAQSAPVQAWRDYAVALSACSADEAAAMTKPQLTSLCTPPEADPLAGA